MEYNTEKKKEKEKKVIQELESQIPTLPEDMFWVEIMPKLPIKPLLRFKCVSKTWLSSISSPQFAKSYFKSYSSSSSSPHQFLLFSGNCKAPDHPLFTWVSIDQHGRVEETISLGFTYKGGVPIYVVGSYNGLVCFFDPQYNFTICNPVTRQCNQIPVIITAPNSGHLLAAGFYYLRSIDDYKIVCLTETYDANVIDEQIGLIVYVFSLRTRQWETLTNVDGYTIARTDVPALVYETIYWYAYQANVVVGVNLVNGHFRTLPSPYANMMIDLHPFSKRVKVFEIEGRLSLYSEDKVWVLDQDGSSWKKLYDLNCKGMRILCVCETTGKWLVLNHGLLALLNPSKSFTRQYQGGTRFYGPIFSVWNFKMSPISPVLE